MASKQGVGWSKRGSSRAAPAARRTASHECDWPPRLASIDGRRPGAPTAAVAQPSDSGQLARVRGRVWMVAEVERDSQVSLDGRPVQHLVRLICEDDATGDKLEVV